MENINAPSITDFSDRFTSALDDYRTHLIAYKMSPEIEEYYNNYTTSQTQLHEINNEIMKFSQDITHEIDDLNKQSFKLSEKMRKAETHTSNTWKRLMSLADIQRSTSVLVGDTTTLYNVQYWQNAKMIMGIILLSGLIYKNMNE